MTPERLRAVFAETLNREMPPFTEDLPFAALPGWDSVAHLALLLAVEQRFCVAFTSAEMIAMHTVGEMLSALETKGEHRA